MRCTYEAHIEGDGQSPVSRVHLPLVFTPNLPLVVTQYPNPGPAASTPKRRQQTNLARRACPHTPPPHQHPSAASFPTLFQEPVCTPRFPPCRRRSPPTARNRRQSAERQQGMAAAEAREKADAAMLQPPPVPRTMRTRVRSTLRKSRSPTKSKTRSCCLQAPACAGGRPEILELLSPGP